MNGNEAGGAAAETPEKDGNTSGQRSCFVIMPYGQKADTASGGTFDFDAVYARLIEPAVANLKLRCIRSDKVSQAGLIHKEMIEDIINSDVAIVDITMGNPNVMYELGVRHTARRSGTVIIRYAGSNIPFNIAGMRVLDYTLPAGNSAEDAELLAAHRKVLERTLKDSLDHRSADSLVHTVVPGLNVALPARVIPSRERHHYPLPGGKQFEIITGDIVNIDDVDAWVNPENTRMELARMHDSSVSASIRYRGAYRDKRGHVKRDAVYNEIRRVLGDRTGSGVEPGTALITRPGALRRPNGVKLIVHVAAHHGEPGSGYQLINSFSNCVTNVLEAIDLHNGKPSQRINAGGVVRSVLFPLFGNRSGGGSPQDVTSAIVHTAGEYVRSWPDTRIDRICFLAYTDVDLEQCKIALKRLKLKCTSCGD